MWTKRILRILALAVPAIAIAAAVTFWLGPPGSRGMVLAIHHADTELPPERGHASVHGATRSPDDRIGALRGERTSE
jgi:hypothetical protein